MESYEILAEAVDGRANDQLSLHVHGTSTSFVASGLRAATSYRFSVAAKNQVGRGPWSAPATVATKLASEKPSAPSEAPEQVPSMACDAITVRLAALRAGCSADTSFTVEMTRAGTKAWRAVATDATSHDITADGLDKNTAYSFRVRARNALGLSEAGPESLPFLAGRTAEQLSLAPQVEALSSSAYRVSWGKMAQCAKPGERRWRLEYRRASEGLHAWRTLIDSTVLTQFEAQLRCPSGCIFRVAATNIEGWSVPSTPSEPLSTKTLHPPAHGAARLELLLPAQESISKQSLEQELASALAIPDSRVHCVEIREAASVGMHALLFDLLPESHNHQAAATKPHASATTSSLWSEADADTLRLAQDLSMQLLSADSALRRGGILSHVAVDAGLMQLSEDGTITRIGAWVPPPSAPPPPPVPHTSWFIADALWLIAIGGLLYFNRARVWIPAARGYAKVLPPQPDESTLLEEEEAILVEAVEVFDDLEHLKPNSVIIDSNAMCDVFDRPIANDTSRPAEVDATGILEEQLPFVSSHSSNVPSLTAKQKVRAEAHDMAQEQAAARASLEAQVLANAEAKAAAEASARAEALAAAQAAAEEAAQAKARDAAEAQAQAQARAAAEARAAEEAEAANAAEARRAAEEAEARRRKAVQAEEDAVDAALQKARFKRADDSSPSNVEQPTKSPQGAGLSVDEAVEAALRAAIASKEQEPLCQGADELVEAALQAAFSGGSQHEEAIPSHVEDKARSSESSRPLL